MSSRDEAWKQIKNNLREHLSKDILSRWFNKVHIKEIIDDSTAVFYVPNPIYQFWLESNYRKIILLSSQKFHKNIQNVKFIILDEDSPCNHKQNVFQFSHNELLESENSEKFISATKNIENIQDSHDDFLLDNKPIENINFLDDDDFFIEKKPTTNTNRYPSQEKNSHSLDYQFLENNNNNKKTDTLPGFSEFTENTETEIIDIKHKISAKLRLQKPNNNIKNYNKSKDKLQKYYSIPKKNFIGQEINAKYSFENFIVDSDAQFAYAAAHSVSQDPAKSYNPLFIFGMAGMGKTHLIQAIGNEICSHSKKKVIYTTSENFTNEFIEAIQHNGLSKFRKKFRNIDVLLIDDIQFLAGKEKSMEEFFHTFNYLMDGRKQIVLTSDRPPNEISSLEKRLVSRFEWGLTVELPKPNKETRIAILQQKMDDWDVFVEKDIINYLADTISSNVRRLEGALLRVASYNSLLGKNVTPENLKTLLKDIFLESIQSKTLKIHDIQKAVCNEFSISREELISKKRSKNVLYPRQIAIKLSREYTNCSLKEIGSAFGKRDHASVIHSCKAFLKNSTKTPEILEKYSIIKKNLLENSN